MRIDIQAVEKQYGAKYIGFYDIPDRENVHVFFQPNPKRELGHSRYFGILTAGERVFICDAASILTAKYNAYRFPDGTYIASRYRHDYTERDGVMIDGGLDYLRCGEKRPNGHAIIQDDGEIFIPNKEDKTSFKLDTSGHVFGGYGPIFPVNGEMYCDVGWSDLTPFQQGAAEAALASVRGFNIPHHLKWDERNGHRSTRFVAFRDLSAATLARIMKDCEKFLQHYPCQPNVSEHMDGNSFWRARQGNNFSEWPPLTLYLGDDGLIHHKDKQP